MTLKSPNGTPIHIRPIKREELDQIPLRCWPEDHAILEKIIESQETLGIAAWEGDICVAQLHCYRINLPAKDNPHWPKWNHWWSSTWWAKVARKAQLDLAGPAWCHACCHVGRTLESFQEEKQLDATQDTPGIRKGTDPEYFGRGIGTALCKASIKWAWEHDYAAILALGAPKGLFEFAIAAGHLPWTTYRKLGFESISLISDMAELPDWASGHGPPEINSEVQTALAAGRPITDFYERLMVLNLKGN